MHGTHRTNRPLTLALLLGLGIALAAPAWAGPREQARRMHDRLVGVPPDELLLGQMAALIPTDPQAAAYLAMDQPAFYTTSLKNWITPWTNVERSVFEPLNDYTATVIGMIRDDHPFNEVLSADLVYVGAPGVVASAYSHTDNDHYQQLEADNVDLSDESLLIPVTQSGLPGSQLRIVDAAGVVTTRAAARAFFSAGTNRRMWRFTAINFLCRDMEDLHDITRANDRIRQDVNRSPGGDSEIFHNQCSGCHSGMDPMAGAYAYLQWDDNNNRLIHTRGQVQPKYLINSNVFPGGFITIDNRWDNFWRQGPNAALGWRGTRTGGYGPQTLGEEVAGSRAFSECQVRKVFERVCLRPPRDQIDRDAISDIADTFEGGGYVMKQVFADVATHCMGN